MKGKKKVDDLDLRKAEYDGEETEEEEEDEEEMKKKTKTKKMAKSVEDKTDEDGAALTEDDLQKSIDQLEAFADQHDPETRRSSLLQKAQEGDLSEDETTELFDLMKGQDQLERTPLVEEVNQNLEENDVMNKALEVSDFLSEQNKELVKSMNTLAQAVSDSDIRHLKFYTVLSKAVAHTGKMCSEINQRLNDLEQQPARSPKSKGLRVMSKSFGGQAENPDNYLSKKQISSALDEMFEKSMRNGQNGVSEDGIDLNIAATEYQLCNTIKPQLLDKVKQHIATKKTAVH